MTTGARRQCLAGLLDEPSFAIPKQLKLLVEFLSTSCSTPASDPVWVKCSQKAANIY